MGLFDRFKNKQEPAASPDALAREGVARVRAIPGVEAVEVVDGDTLSVTWEGVEEPAPLSLTEIREPWTAASGFDRIEVMDDFIAQVGPPSGAAPDLPGVSFKDDLGASPPEPVAPVEETTPIQDGADLGPDADTAWEAIRPRLHAAVGRPAPAEADTVRWPVGGVLEATVVLDDPVAVPVSRNELTDWGVDEETVRATAEANQAALDPALDPIGPDEPAWVPTRPAGHLAGWLSAPDRLLAAADLDEAVVLTPLPTELVVVDPGATALVESILRSTRTIVEQEPDTLWPAPFLVRPGSVEPWSPDPDHPCAALVDEMRGLAR